MIWLIDTNILLRLVQTTDTMKAHDIQNLLIFNAKDFKRYIDIKAVKPKDV
jgi:predicted nucleic-acid-binding protein